MPERIRFHLDENVDPDIASALRRAEIDVTTSQGEKLLSKSDLDQLNFANSQSRVLVTHDDDFLILSNQGFDHCGIVYTRKDVRTIGYLVRMLILLSEVVSLEEMKNHVEYL